jgi:hypothetical protein
MDKPPPDRFLTDRLVALDEARNARPHVPQQPSDMVKKRDDLLASQSEKIAALKHARETATTPNAQSSIGDSMARKRELLDTGTDKRYVRRNERGTSFVESDDVGRSLAADGRKRAKTRVESGQGDKGDRARPKAKRKATSESRKKAGPKGRTRKSVKTRSKPR